MRKLYPRESSRFDTEIMHFTLSALSSETARFSMCLRIIHAQTKHEKSCVRTCSQSDEYILLGPCVGDAPPHHRLIPSTHPPVRGPKFSYWHIAWSLRSHSVIQAPNLLPPQSPQMDSPLPEGSKPQQEKPTVVQIDPKWCAKLISLLQPGNC